MEPVQATDIYLLLTDRKKENENEIALRHVGCVLGSPKMVLAQVLQDYHVHRIDDFLISSRLPALVLQSKPISPTDTFLQDLTKGAEPARRGKSYTRKGLQDRLEYILTHHSLQ